MKPKHLRPSLYDRLGGVYNIAPVVDNLIDHVMIDPRLNANPRVDEAHHRVSAAGFKYFVTEMLCEAAGGPQRDLVPCSAVTLATSKFQGDGPTAHPSSQAGTSSTDRTHWHCYSIADPLSCSPPWLKAAAWSLEAWSSGLR